MALRDEMRRVMRKVIADGGVGAVCAVRAGEEVGLVLEAVETEEVVVVVWVGRAGPMGRIRVGGMRMRS